MSQENIIAQLKKLGFESAFAETPLSQEDLTCNEVRALLNKYWQEPQIFSKGDIFKISYHLTHCKNCREKFVKIREGSKE